MGTYALIRKCGGGGAGEVWEARDEEDEVWAVKLLRPEVSSAGRRRYLNELRFCFKQEHPLLIRAHDYGFTLEGDEKSLFYVMPYFERTLRDEIKRRPPATEALRFAVCLAEAVAASHRQGVVHRDLKPENVLVDAGGQRLVLTDFGIANLREEDRWAAFESGKAERLANFTYAAPEQRVRDAKVDKAADLYALGLIIHELFTRVVPLGRDPGRIDELDAQYQSVDEVVHQLLQQNPEKRPASIELVLKSLGAPTSQAEAQASAPRVVEVVQTDVAPTLPRPPVAQDLAWLVREQGEAVHQLQAGGHQGYWDAHVGIASQPSPFKLPRLVDAVRAAQLRGTGWPIGVLLDGQPAFRPAFADPGVRCSVGGNARTFDFWSLHPNGAFFTLRNLAQFEARADVLWLEQPIWNAVHLLLFIRRLYRGLSVPDETPFELRMRYVGLRGRRLESAGRRVLIDDLRNDTTDVVETGCSGLLHQIEGGELEQWTCDIASKVLLPFSLFDLGRTASDAVVRAYRKTIGA